MFTPNAKSGIIGVNIDKEEDIMVIEFIKTADLVPYANNSRTHTREQIEQVAASIREFGFTNLSLIHISEPTRPY